MSSASVPAPRSAPPSSGRHSLFWPFLVLLIGIGVQAVSAILSMEDHLDEITRAEDKVSVRANESQHERIKFYALAGDVLALAPTDPIAEKIVQKFKIREMKAAEPALFDAPRSVVAPNPLQANTVTNAPTGRPAPAPTLPPLNTGTVPTH